jgi:uncharacterized NAD(P)/FAD-binding protein YdhS
MKRTRVVVVGAGFSGVALAAQLVRQKPVLDVVLIERGRRFGPGLAYSTKDTRHLLNVGASNMSALADQPDDFVRWLRGRGRRDAGVFAPRRNYGDYIEGVLSRARSARWRGGFKQVRDEALACRRGADNWRVTLAAGPDIEADAVVLALGHAPQSPLVAFAQAGVTPLEPWRVDALRAISPAASVLIMGAGLTMVDVVLSLTKRQRTGTIYALSRRGLAPRAHLEFAAPPGEPLRLPVALSAALREFRREVERMQARGEPWQMAMDRLRAESPALWRRLPPDAQQRFLRHLRPWWDVHRHRAAPDVAARIAALQSEGRLRVMAGEVVAVRTSGNTIEMRHRQRGSLVRHRIEVARVINCTGASNDLSRSAAAIVRQLLEEGVARAHATGLGLDVDEEGRVLAQSGAVQAGLYALGPITQGAFWEATAVPEIRARAAALAEIIRAGYHWRHDR